jgi:hypothetical protein
VLVVEKGRLFKPRTRTVAPGATPGT